MGLFWGLWQLQENQNTLKRAQLFQKSTQTAASGHTDLDEELDVQEVVLSDLALQVVHHPLGAALQQVAELRLGVVAGPVVLVVPASTVLEREGTRFRNLTIVSR